MKSMVPTEFFLSQNYPNPFSGKTSIKFCVACKTRIKLEVLDSKGRTVRTLLNEEKEPGTYKVELDASSLPRSGPGTAETCYRVRLQAGDFSATKEMLIKQSSM